MNRQIDYFIAGFIIIASLSLFEFILFPRGVIRFAEIIGIAAVIVVNILYVVYGQKIEGHTKIFRSYIHFIILSSFLSVFASFLWHQQNPLTTLFEQRFIFFYLFYFTLHFICFKPEDLERVLVAIGIFVACIYVIQYFLYPSKIIDVPMRLDRGTLRISLQGLIYHQIAYLYFFNKILNRISFRHFVPFLFLFCVFILYGSRADLLINIASLLILLSISKNIQSKYIIGFLTISVIALVLFQFRDIFVEFIKVSKQDIGETDNYIRYRAAEYFLGEFYPNKLAYITGNGLSSANSSYGKQLTSLIKSHGYYLSDLGVIMPYVTYGVFFVGGILFLLIKAVRIKVSENLLYLKVILINLLIYFPLSGGLDNPAFIVCFAIVLYIVEEKNLKKKDKTLIT